MWLRQWAGVQSYRNDHAANNSPQTENQTVRKTLKSQTLCKKTDAVIA